MNYFDILGQARLGAAVVYVPTRTTLYIDVSCCDDTRTIMRAERIAIHTALIRFHDHLWLRICTDSLSSLQAILHHYISRDSLPLPITTTTCFFLRTSQNSREPSGKWHIHNPKEDQSTHTHTGQRSCGSRRLSSGHKLRHTTTGAYRPSGSRRSCTLPPIWVMYTPKPQTATTALATSP
jgi:hypothetical protein